MALIIGQIKGIGKRHFLKKVEYHAGSYILEFLAGFAPLYLPAIGFVLKLREEAFKKADIRDHEAQLEEAKKEYQETEEIIKNTAEIDIPPRFRHVLALEY